MRPLLPISALLALGLCASGCANQALNRGSIPPGVTEVPLLLVGSPQGSGVSGLWRLEPTAVADATLRGNVTDSEINAWATPLELLPPSAGLLPPLLPAPLVSASGDRVAVAEELSPDTARVQVLDRWGAPVDGYFDGELVGLSALLWVPGPDGSELVAQVRDPDHPVLRVLSLSDPPRQLGPAVEGDIRLAGRGAADRELLLTADHGSPPVRGLWSVDLASDDSQLLTPGQTLPLANPAAHHSGLLAAEQLGAYRVDMVLIDGVESSTLTPDGWTDCHSPRWSSGAPALAFLCAAETGRTDLVIWSPVDGLRVVSAGLGTIDLQLAGLRWHPSEDQLLFTAWNESRAELYLYDHASGQLDPLLDEEGFEEPSSTQWLPDGRILFWERALTAPQYGMHIFDPGYGRLDLLLPGTIEGAAISWSYPVVLP